jgi:hypothetical protein
MDLAPYLLGLATGLIRACVPRIRAFRTGSATADEAPTGGAAREQTKMHHMHIGEMHGTSV